MKGIIIKFWKKTRLKFSEYMLKQTCPKCKKYGTFTTLNTTCLHCGYTASKQELAEGLENDRRDKALIRAMGINVD